jgi:hypothetical protein
MNKLLTALVWLAQPQTARWMLWAALILLGAVGYRIAGSCELAGGGCGG